MSNEYRQAISNEYRQGVEANLKCRVHAARREARRKNVKEFRRA